MLGKLFAFVFLLFCSSFATPVPVVLGLNSGSIVTDH